MIKTGTPQKATKITNSSKEELSRLIKLGLFIRKITAWIKIYGLRYSLVLVIPMIIIFCSSLFGLEIITYLFVAAGISNLIALVDINSELCKKAKKQEGSLLLFSQLVLLAFIIAFSLSLIFIDNDVKSNNIIVFFVIGLFLTIFGLYYSLFKNMKHGNYVLFLGIVLIAIYGWVFFNKYKSQTFGAPIHLLFLPLFFFVFDGIRFYFQEVIKLKEYLKLDFGLVVVGIITFLTGFVAKIPLPYFEAGSAAAILIIGNYFYLLLSTSEIGTSLE